VSCEVQSVTVIPNDRRDATPSAIVLTGVQHVRKFNSATADKVRIILALYRVERKKVDLVVTINIPMTSSDSGSVSEEGWKMAQADFQTFVTSLRIIDFDLFV
jgi:Ran-interacting Mog1 protein